MAKGQNSSQETSGLKTKIFSCKCKHEAQDELYGKNMRLHNKTTSQYRCTVCATVR